MKAINRELGERKPSLSGKGFRKKRNCNDGVTIVVVVVVVVVLVGVVEVVVR